MESKHTVRAHYVATDQGEFRFFKLGEGPPLVAIGGLATGAEALTHQLAEVFPERTVIAVEPPGVGGSARVRVSSLDQARQATRSLLDTLNLADSPIIAADLSAALLNETVTQWPTPVAWDSRSALGWAGANSRPPDLTPRDDGTHLNALWIFLRDRGILNSSDPTLPRSDGPLYPTPPQLSQTFVAAMTDTRAFQDLWNACIAEFQNPSETLAEILKRSAQRPLMESVTQFGSFDSPEIPASHSRRSAPNSRIWLDYVDTAHGRVHLRRAGHDGFPIIVLPTGGGSSAQFEPVITGLAHDRTVIGIDYLGNGLSDKPPGEGAISDLAYEVLSTMDALDIPQADLWGSHTGACIGLEISVIAPDRVRRLVMEGPVVVSPEFREDLLANYFPDFTPDTFGLHLQHVWHWRRDMFMFWPWYQNDPSAARRLGVPTAEEIHLYAVGILESGSTYSRAYRAAFAYPTLERLPRLSTPSIITAGPNDMLANALDDVLEAIPAEILSVIPTPTTVWWPDPDPVEAEASMEIYRNFLNAPRS